MAVSLEHQRRGAGSALLESGPKAADDVGAAVS